MTHQCFIGIGSNIEDPLAQVERAVKALAELPDTRLVRISPWYGSKAIGPGEQPDYVNGVAELATSLAPEALLNALQRQEKRQRRERDKRWGPRTLDLDILLYGNRVIDTERLAVPHPRLRERPFILRPLHDIAPTLTLPDGTSLDALLDYLPSDDVWLLQATWPGKRRPHGD